MTPRISENLDSKFIIPIQGQAESMVKEKQKQEKEEGRGNPFTQSLDL